MLYRVGKSNRSQSLFNKSDYEQKSEFPTLILYVGLPTKLGFRIF